MKSIHWEVYDPATGAHRETCATRAAAVQVVQAAQQENGRDFALRTVPDYGQLHRTLEAADHEALLDPRGPAEKWPETDEIQKAVFITVSDCLKLLHENAELRGSVVEMMLLVLHSRSVREDGEQYRWLRWRTTETHQVEVWLEELDAETGGEGGNAHLTIQESEENK